MCECPLFQEAHNLIHQENNAQQNDLICLWPLQVQRIASQLI